MSRKGLWSALGACLLVAACGGGEPDEPSDPVSLAGGAAAPMAASVPDTATADFSVSPAELSFAGINGATFASQQLSLAIDPTVKWKATSSAKWLKVTASGTQLTATVDPKGLKNFASGAYAGAITVTTRLAARSIPVSLSLTKAVITASTESLLLGAGTQTVTFSLNTGGAGYAWQLNTVQTPAGWMGAVAASNMKGASSVAVALSATGAPPPGNFADLTVSAKVNGDIVSKTVSVTTGSRPGNLLLSEAGVALSATPSWSRLSRTVAIRDTSGGRVGWTATSDKDWLTVTPGGMTDDAGRSSLSIQASAAGLATDTFSVATVTLAPAGGVGAPAKLVVGLWNGSTTPTAITKFPLSYSVIVADPVRPLVYAHKGDGTVDVFNVYLQSLQQRITGVGAALGSMAVSADGSKLFAIDSANRAISVVDLQTGTVQAPLALVSAVAGSTGLGFARPNGVDMLLLGDRSAYTVSPWQLARYGSSWYPDVSVAAAADGSRVVYGGTSLSPSYASAYNIAMIGSTFSSTFIGQSGSYPVASNGKEAALSLDGTRYYSASGAPYACLVWSATDGSYIGALPAAGAYPNNVKVASDGRIFCGIFGWYSSADVWMYSPSGALLRSFKFAGYARALLDRQFVVSGDALVGAALTDDPFLVFIPIGP